MTLARSFAIASLERGCLPTDFLLSLIIKDGRNISSSVQDPDHLDPMFKRLVEDQIVLESLYLPDAKFREFRPMELLPLAKFGRCRQKFKRSFCRGKEANRRIGAVALDARSQFVQVV